MVCREFECVRSAEFISTPDWFIIILIVAVTLAYYAVLALRLSLVTCPMISRVLTKYRESVHTHISCVSFDR
jgi:hypothetical protein